MFTRDRSDFSGSSGLSEKMFEEIRRAGYTLEDEKSIELGMLAYSMASIIWSNRTLPPAHHRPQEKTGRNAPCQCGSGRKYKKCCGFNKETETQPWIRRPQRAEMDWRCIPALNSANLQEDLGSLSEVIDEDPELREYVFSPRDVADFYQAEKKRVQKDGEKTSDENEFVDDIAMRYGRRKINPNRLKQLGELFEKKAGQTEEPDRFRVLATGRILCMLHEGEKGADSLIASLLFRIALKRHMRTAQIHDSIQQRLGGPEQLLQTNAQDPKWLENELQDALAGVDQKDLDNLMEQSRVERENRRKDFIHNPLPVGVPVAAVLPFLVELERFLETEGSGLSMKSERKALVRLLNEAAARFLPEDRELFDRRLAEWLERNPQADAPAITRVHNVRRILKIAMLTEGFLPIFFMQSVQSTLDEIPEIVDVIQYPGQPGNLDADFLEIYGDYLLGQGYPKAIVLRTWKLCEKYGPVSDGLAEKIRRLSEEISSAPPAQDQRQDTGVIEADMGQ